MQTLQVVEKQKLLHVDHLNYEEIITPLLQQNWFISQIQVDGHNGLWILMQNYGSIPVEYDGNNNFAIASL